MSVFTNDVENNQFGCKPYAYYDNGGMNELTMQYNSTIGNFVKAIITDKANNLKTV